MASPREIRHAMEMACYQATASLRFADTADGTALPGSHWVRRGVRADGARVWLCHQCRRVTVTGYQPIDITTQAQLVAWHDQDPLPDHGLRAVILRSTGTTGVISEQHERVVIVGHAIPPLHAAGPDAPPVEVGRHGSTVFVWPADRPPDTRWSHTGAYVRPAGSAADWTGVFGHRLPVPLYDTVSP